MIWTPKNIIHSVLLAGAFFGGIYLRDQIADADIAELQLEHRTRIADIDVAHRAQLQAMTDAARDAERFRVIEMATIDAQHTEELTNAKRETDAALAAVRSGELRLRNRFTCDAAAGDGVPATGASAGVDRAGEGSGLQREDAEFLVRLAAEADDVVRQLRACQAVIAADRQAR